MKKPNLREQFEKETNFSAIIGDMRGQNLYHTRYTEYLETINSEMIDALVESTKLLEHLKSVETESELINQIEQQIEMNKYSALKKRV